MRQHNSKKEHFYDALKSILSRWNFYIPEIYILNSLHADTFFMLVLSSAYFFQNELFQKKSFRNAIRCQTVLIQIRTDVLSVLIWITTVCKGHHQQTTKVAASKLGVRALFMFQKYYRIRWLVR